MHPKRERMISLVLPAVEFIGIPDASDTTRVPTGRDRWLLARTKTNPNDRNFIINCRRKRVFRRDETSSRNIVSEKKTSSYFSSILMRRFLSARNLIKRRLEIPDKLDSKLNWIKLFITLIEQQYV